MSTKNLRIYLIANLYLIDLGQFWSIIIAVELYTKKLDNHKITQFTSITHRVHAT